MSFEGLIILAIVYFVLNRIAKAGKKVQARLESARGQAGGIESQSAPEEGLSLEKVLREIERIKTESEQGRRPVPKPAYQPRTSPEGQQRLGRMQQAAQAAGRLQVLADPIRGPLGRPSRVSRPSSEESLEGASFDEAVQTRVARVDFDQDEQVEATVQRRLNAAQHRTREGREANYQAEQKTVRDAAASVALSAQAASARLRRAVIWSEILGTPVGMRGE